MCVCVLTIGAHSSEDSRVCAAAAFSRLREIHLALPVANWCTGSLADSRSEHQQRRLLSVSGHSTRFFVAIACRGSVQLSPPHFSSVLVLLETVVVVGAALVSVPVSTLSSSTSPSSVSISSTNHLKFTDLFHGIM